LSTQVEVPLDKLKPPSRYIREQVDEGHVEFLVGDIERRGLLEPLLVKPLGEGLYEIIDGAHRFSALKKLGYRSAPCVVKEASKQEAIILQLITNYRAKRLRDHELVKAVALLHDELGMRFDAIGSELGYAKSYMSMLYKIYRDREVYGLLKEGAITLTEAYNRVKGKPSSIIEHDQIYGRCVICREQRALENSYRALLCLNHAQYLEKWLKAAREIYLLKGNEGLKEFSNKLEEVAGEVAGRRSSTIEPSSKPLNQTVKHKEGERNE